MSVVIAPLSHIAGQLYSVSEKKTFATKMSHSRHNAMELYNDTLWNNHNVEFCYCNNTSYFATLYTSYN
jgi:hypothetical protein